MVEIVLFLSQVIQINYYVTHDNVIPTAESRDTTRARKDRYSILKNQHPMPTEAVNEIAYQTLLGRWLPDLRLKWLCVSYSRFPSGDSISLRRDEPRSVDN